MAAWAKIINCGSITSMTKVELAAGLVHKMPADLHKALISDEAALAAWNAITPIARNEWICWVENAKQLETRTKRIQRTHTELAEGKRRPCCWIGCIHRTDKAMSPSQKYVLSKQSK